MNHFVPSREEIPFAFGCQGEELIGCLHQGAADCAIGVLTIVAGGPQYRGGVGRQLVYFSRRFAAEGIPVMRFDHRGMGDSEGTFRRFSAMQEDLAAAIAQFKERAPAVRGIILWGGCDAATSALINAHRFPDVVGVVAANPFVSSPATSAKARRGHYLNRLLQVSFWKKLARMEYKLGDYATAALRKRVQSTRGDQDQPSASGTETTDNSKVDDSGFLNDLLTGLQQFDGKVLFLMGGGFLASDEFDLLGRSTRAWKAALNRSTQTRIDIEDGDQLFTTASARDSLYDAASQWIRRSYSAQLPVRSE